MTNEHRVQQSKRGSIDYRNRMPRTLVTQSGKSKEPGHWTWSFPWKIGELSVMLQYWAMSSLPLFYLGAHSQLFRTDTHLFFLIAPSMAHFFLQKYDTWE